MTLTYLIGIYFISLYFNLGFSHHSAFIIHGFKSLEDVGWPARIYFYAVSFLGPISSISFLLADIVWLKLEKHLQ